MTNNDKTPQETAEDLNDTALDDAKGGFSADYANGPVSFKKTVGIGTEPSNGKITGVTEPVKKL